MALVKCPECSTEVSEAASTCPKCGFPSPGKPPAPDTVSAEVKQVFLKEGKIAAIKRCRERHPGMELKDAKEYVEALQRKDPEMAASPQGKGCLGMLALIVGAVLALGYALHAGS